MNGNVYPPNGDACCGMSTQPNSVSPDLSVACQMLMELSISDNPSSKEKVESNWQPIVKEWQKQINPELRSHLAKKLMNAIFPMDYLKNFPNQDANGRPIIEERILKNLESFSKKVEGDIYDAANSKSEYYHLLAEKYYKINKELDERKEKRKLQLLQHQQMQHQQMQQQQLQQQQMQLQQMQHQHMQHQQQLHHQQLQQQHHQQLLQQHLLLQQQQQQQQQQHQQQHQQQQQQNQHRN